MRAETRHQLKQDAFSRVTIGAAEDAAHWSIEHKNTLIIAGISVAVVLALVFGGWYYLSQQDEKASLEFAQAVRTTETPLRPAGTPAQPDVPASPRPRNAPKPREKNFRKYSTSILTPTPPIWPNTLSA